MEKRNKILIIIIIVLVVAIGVTGTFAYQNYRMSEVDKLMLENNNVLGPQLNAKIAEADNLSNSTPTDYDKLGNVIDDAIDLENKIIANDEKAYQFADGPYKELLDLALKKSRLTLNLLNSWRSRVEYIKQGDTAQALQLLSQEQSLVTELTKAENDYTNFKSTHPEVKEHSIKYWNSTNT